MTKAKDAADETQPSREALAKARDEAVDKKGEALDKLADAEGKAADIVESPTEEAIDATEEAALRQGQIDRLDQHTRAESPKPSLGQRTRGVVNDAWGGPTAERERLEEDDK